MSIRIYSAQAVEQLEDWAEDTDWGWYQGVDEQLPSLPTLQAAVSATGPLPILRVDGTSQRTRAGGDLENAVALYRWLPDLSPVQASDVRLWVWLCHHPFRDYVRARWPEGSPDALRSHWFFKGRGLGALRRNALSRLWWAVHLTQNPVGQLPEWASVYQPSNPFEYTALLLGRQDVYQALIERSFGSDRRLLFAALESLRHRDEDDRGRASKQIGKELNLVLRYRDLGCLRGRGIFEAVARAVEPDTSR